jgi:hypothetical protein
LDIVVKFERSTAREANEIAIRNNETAVGNAVFLLIAVAATEADTEDLFILTIFDDQKGLASRMDVENTYVCQKGVDDEGVGLIVLRSRKDYQNNDGCGFLLVTLSAGKEKREI